MKYIALIRGINVGGNNMIKMDERREAVGKSGFKNVSTYIQSGNVLFESDKYNIENITKTLEDTLLKNINTKSVNCCTAL